MAPAKPALEPRGTMKRHVERAAVEKGRA